MSGIDGTDKSDGVRVEPEAELPLPILRRVLATDANSASRSVSEAVRRRLELRLGAMRRLPERPSGTTKPWLEMALSSDACDEEVAEAWYDMIEPEAKDEDRVELESGTSGSESRGGTKTVDAEPEPLADERKLAMVGAGDDARVISVAARSIAFQRAPTQRTRSLALSAASRSTPSV